MLLSGASLSKQERIRTNTPLVSCVCKPPVPSSLVVDATPDYYARVFVFSVLLVGAIDARHFRRAGGAAICSQPPGGALVAGGTLATS